MGCQSIVNRCWYPLQIGERRQEKSSLHHNKDVDHTQFGYPLDLRLPHLGPPAHELLQFSLASHWILRAAFDFDTRLFQNNERRYEFPSTRRANPTRENATLNGDTPLITVIPKVCDSLSFKLV